MSNIDFDIKGIGKFIKENTFRIPIYQRPYSWTEKQIDELFEDLNEAINNNDDEYFLGTIVLTKDEDDDRGTLEVVDGQQRITTLTIFFETLRHHLSKKANTNLQNEYLSTYEYRTESRIPKLVLNKSDDSFFKNFIIGEDHDFPTSKESHKRIKTALATSEKFLVRLLNRHNSDINILYDWKDYIDEKLKVVIIIVPSEANAYTIFETLNDRGLELAQIDLLKNYLYSKAGNRLDEALSIWGEISSKIESDFEENILLTYIKHYWAATRGFVRETNRELYNQIKQQIKTQTNVITFLTDLQRNLEIYLAILNSESQFWSAYDPKCKDYVHTLNYFGLEQYRPLLLSILIKFPPEEVVKSLKLLVAWMVRNLIIGKLRGGTLEKAYVENANKIYQGDITSARTLRENLRSLIPTDDEFESGFKIATVSKHKLARYYLRAIENYRRGTDFPELLVNTNPNAVNLEHILPQKTEGNWPQFSVEEAEQYVKRIGNLTLMNTKENNDFKSSSFEVKLQKYRESELWITNSLENYPEWNTRAIIRRQEELAKLAVKTWSLRFA